MTALVLFLTLLAWLTFMGMAVATIFVWYAIRRSHEEMLARINTALVQFEARQERWHAPVEMHETSVDIFAQIINNAVVNFENERLAA